MPRARDPSRDKAREMWEASGRTLKLCDIAEKLHVPEATVRAWKSKDKWDGGAAKKNEGNAPKKKRSVPNDEGNAPKRKRGGQPGNKNGKGAPVGNIRAATHGAYINFYKTVLSEEESSLLPVLAEQREQDRLRTLYAQHQITERRLMDEIYAIQNGEDTIVHKTTSQVEPTGTKSADGRELTKVVKINQEKLSRKDQLRVFTEALTRVRAEMRRVAEALTKLEPDGDEDGVASLVDAINAAWEEGDDG